jgi:phosphatidylserine decarboxylase
MNKDKEIERLKEGIVYLKNIIEIDNLIIENERNALKTISWTLGTICVILAAALIGVLI